jgi:hypothetical protein
MAIATGQLTIIDYNDAISLTGFIASNRPKTQMYNQDNGSYTPDWTSSPLILTPSLFILGTATDIIANAAVTSILWYDITAGTETAIVTGGVYAVGASGAKALTITGNILAGLPGKEIMCKIVYHDASTNLDLVLKINISLSRVVNGSGIADALSWAPNGNVFKNGTVASLIAQCDLWRGSVIDATLVTYQWFQQDPTITSGSGSLYDAAAGAGWRKLANAANVFAGVTTNQLTIYPVSVAGYGVFMCLIKDTDAASATYDTYFKDTLTVSDQSDSIQLDVTSTGGNIFKNGVGSSVLTARVFRGGVEIDVTGVTYAYKWYKYDKDGVQDPNFGGAGVNYKTGKTLTVGDADVLIKATFFADIN